MNPRTRAALAVSASALAVAALLTWGLRPQAPAAGQAAPTPTAVASEPVLAATVPETMAGEPPVRAAAVALPLPDAPLARILPELVRRADAGDRKAACRLSMELLRCEHLADWASMAMPDNDGGEPERDARVAQALQDHEERTRLWELERRLQCRDVPAALVGQGSRYLVQAARAGEPEAMLRYADGHHWPPSGRGILADPGFDAWRRDAAAMAHRALAAGQPQAAFLLSIGYSDDFGLLAGLVPNDPEESLAMMMLYKKSLGLGENLRFPDTLGAAAVARARDRADALHQRYFRGRRIERSAGMLHPVFVAPSPGTDVRYCEQD